MEDRPARSVLDTARRLQALGRTGLHFAADPYDRQRWEEIERLAAELVQEATGRPVDETAALWAPEGGYVTPKLDVRAATFREGSVLLVRERSDGRWSLPGGWVDVNESPSFAVTKELEQESGFRGVVVKVAAVWDRRRHEHPPHLFHVWKVFFLVELVGGEARASDETDAVAFHPLDALPPLSPGRVTARQLRRMWDHWRDRALPTDFD